MRILVTGATGNIGRHVVAGLVGAGRRVRAMTRTTQDLHGVEVVTGDFTDPSTWPSALAGVTRMYVFSRVPPELVAQAAEAGVRRFVVHSAAAAGFPPRGRATALDRHLEEERVAHRAVEASVEATGAEWAHIRPGLLAINTLAWAPRVRAERVVREPYPSAGYPVVHEADVADVAVAALVTDDHVGQALTITGPAKVTQVEQVAAIAAAIGEPVRLDELSPEEARVQWLADGCPAGYLDWRLELLADAREGDGALPPTDTFERVAGRPPRTFAQWAIDHAADFR
ncbi:NAD(P)H-binding protein [Amycolatopsis sp. A133]|uniref:NAD(P)H-binding protein n=1 Tax=Amycolatopsis sp. A133 TaxID=3064472 RepID=UPI0027FBEFDF|nr:NAD(P)H-binding protein [Amycolatopsis sp. A133]MDQ7809128.1 NAD(P)H-binding protein [Amycolatopsis sp. A133]